jgi:PTS system nitrogen regulatory IIA component
MDLDKSLFVDCIDVHASCSDKPTVLSRIAALAKQAPSLNSVPESDILDALVAREGIGSTGFEDGIAIPHCRLAGVTEFVVGLLIVPGGVDFDAMDGEDTRLIFFVIGPDDRNAYVRLLSSISRTVGTQETRRKVLAATTREHVYDLLVGTTPRTIQGTQPMPQCTFQVVIQDEDVFSDVLQAVSSLTDGVDVIETRGAGHYLHNLPLFSTFWTNEEKQFHRIILGVVRRDLANELARSINVAAGGLDHRSGVLLAVQDCLFCQGSLEA